MKSRKHKFVRVKIKPLGQYRQKVSKKHYKIPLGVYLYATDEILLDPRQNQKCLLNTIIHEMLHRECPGWSESKVMKTADNISRVVWYQGYRKEI